MLKSLKKLFALCTLLGLGSVVIVGELMDDHLVLLTVLQPLREADAPPSRPSRRSRIGLPPEWRRVVYRIVDDDRYTETLSAETDGTWKPVGEFRFTRAKR